PRAERPRGTLALRAARPAAQLALARPALAIAPRLLRAAAARSREPPGVAPGGLGAGRAAVALVGTSGGAEAAVAALQQAHAAAWGTRARAPAPGCREPHEETAPARPARREARLRASAGTTLAVGPQVAKIRVARREERAALSSPR